MWLHVFRSDETFAVIMETEGEIYFYDEYDRWCYFFKSEEGLYFEYTNDENAYSGLSSNG